MLPLPGLSIIIHTLIIIIRKITEKFHINLQFGFYKKRIFSYVIIFTISLLVVGNTFLLLRFSVKNNNYILAKDLFPRQTSSISVNYLKNSTLSQVSDNNTSTPVASLENNISVQDKSIPADFVQNGAPFSIVDFLVLNGIDFSIDNRKLMATKFGINDYVGSAEQNLELLGLLRESKSFDERVLSTKK
jgi:hypothetical protein